MTVSRYRKKPVVIEAVQYDGSNFEELRRFAPGSIFESQSGSITHGGPPEYEPTVKTLEGPLRVAKGDWLIRGVKGEFYPCKPDIFEATYEAVDSGGEGVNRD